MRQDCLAGKRWSTTCGFGVSRSPGRGYRLSLGEMVPELEVSGHGELCGGAAVLA